MDPVTSRDYLRTWGGYIVSGQPFGFPFYALFQFLLLKQKLNVKYIIDIYKKNSVLQQWS